jgi:hypothetical protein
MKLVTKILSLLVLTGLTFFYAGCGGGGGESETEEQKQLKKLSSTWAISSANDGTDRTADFPSLVMTVSGTFAQGGTYNYSFTGTRPNPSPWPVSGTWKFGTTVSSEIIRDPGTASETNVGYGLSADGNTLTLTFNVPSGSTGWAGGTSRVESVTGDWTFVFTKQ